MPIPFSLRLLGHTTNQRLLNYLSEQSQKSGSKWTENPSCSPEGVEQPYLRLGAHPNVVTRLWNTFATALPTQCNWVVYGMPVLVNPESAVIFAFAHGTVYALRLPTEARSEALELGLTTVHTFNEGATLNLANFAAGWVYGRGLGDEQRWCVKAFEHAAAWLARGCVRWN
jgi:hypothetical protein